MNSTNKKSIHAIFILIVGGAVIAAVVLLLLRSSNPAEHAVGVLRAGPLEIPVSIADTEASREQGLSGTLSLLANSGKLFVFPSPGNYGFWMKDMNYALDFVWIGSDLKIVGITPDIAASTYPQIFYPPAPAQYVLEVNSGFSTRVGLKVGEQLSYKK
jgi:uncharacterized membrane protein (UPF0127 family)